MAATIPDGSELIVGKKQRVGLVKIAPAGAVRLNRDVIVDGNVLIPVGTIMAPSVLPGLIYCEVSRRPKQDFFKCLEDTDGDRVLDNYSSTFAREYYAGSTVKYEYMLGKFDPWNHHALPGPLALSIFEDADGPVVTMELDLIGNGKRNSTFRLCTAPVGRIDELCMDPFRIDIAQLPASTKYFGLQLTLTSLDADSVHISFVPPAIGSVLD
ncbi:hypothetical protein HNP52_001223 [Sphingomonas kyeonggiensis]|uniref:Uncharacterized protein n=1 Tax=Sphingomonas kyeonggiensis TaxID=1268553 RepID=A0A7W7NRU3_9SPHN|nr:hypothetical protein [Sphingomonas kyeonggiensis]MBB4838172.1 hypothetical protein [Sphingomonas kyeonggiensis]